LLWAGGGVRLLDGSGKLSMHRFVRILQAANMVEYDLLETGRTQLILPMLLKGIQVVQDAEQKAGHYSRDISLKEIFVGILSIDA